MAIITTLEVGASCVGRVAFLNQAGAPGDIDGGPSWSSDNDNAVTITVRSDGLTADITRVTADPVNITVTGKSITAGAPDVVVTAALPLPAVVVVTNPAVSATLIFEDS